MTPSNPMGCAGRAAASAGAAAGAAAAASQQRSHVQPGATPAPCWQPTGDKLYYSYNIIRQCIATATLKRLLGQTGQDAWSSELAMAHKDEPDVCSHLTSPGERGGFSAALHVICLWHSVWRTRAGGGRGIWNKAARCLADTMQASMDLLVYASILMSALGKSQLGGGRCARPGGKGVGHRHTIIEDFHIHRLLDCRNLPQLLRLYALISFHKVSLLQPCMPQMSQTAMIFGCTIKVPARRVPKHFRISSARVTSSRLAEVPAWYLCQAQCRATAPRLLRRCVKYGSPPQGASNAHAAVLQNFSGGACS